MFATLHLPDFHLQCVLRDDPLDLDDALVSTPVAVLEPSPTPSERSKARILQLSQAAAVCHGVERGMTASQGLARCAELLLLERDRHAEAVAQEDLLACAEHFTPDFESTALGAATLDLAGSTLGAEELARQAIRWLSAANLAAGVGVANNPDLAQIAAATAGGGQFRILPEAPAEVRKFLAPLPVATVFEFAPDTAPDLPETLRLWGIRTLGQLAALPRAEVASRLGPAAATLYDHATGARRRLLRLHRAPTSFAASSHLEDPVTTLDPLLFYVRRLLGTITARLAAAYLVAAELSLTLTFTDETSHQRTFRIPEPSRDADLLLSLVHTHLEDFSARAPVGSLALEARPSRPGRHQFDLFVSGLRDPNRFAETLARIEALLGPERVGTPEPLASHRPDAFTLHPFSEPQPLSPPPDVRRRPGLPLRRFRPPVPARVTTEGSRPSAIQSPRASGRIAHRCGPWLTSTDWWEERLRHRRQEWDIQLEDGSAYLLVCQQHTWTLQGTY